ncbi:hypothetical protein [Aureispira anguillae]|uniref:Uncharacterized protein n=1 Tax=Aureispira anguillae TaxID=2864201 RepID=A0A916DS93_9BACT|nr:hypothetical protein [Aureispira anguillae]BDS12384.1 hypothetical protein AsAng_0031050 [Aureispira anguillae]
MANVKRIYAPFTTDLCMATPWAYVDSKLSYRPLTPGTVEQELITDVQKAGGIVDHNYSILAQSKEMAEQGQLELTLMLSDEKDAEGNFRYQAKEMVRVGINRQSMDIFPSDPSFPTGLVVGGTFGEETLDIIARLAREGKSLTINGMHIDADDDKHFTAKMIERQFKHDGSSLGDKNILYPKSLASDEQTTIRVIADINVKLDGFGYLEIPIYRGIGANLTLDTTFARS